MASWMTTREPFHSGERFFNAIKGHGGHRAIYQSALEAHGYRGRENILHMLAEQNSWLEKYVKNAPASGIPPAPILTGHYSCQDPFIPLGQPDHSQAVQSAHDKIRWVKLIPAVAEIGSGGDVCGGCYGKPLHHQQIYETGW